ncbi:hypothetical protein IU436_28375 [Nocardia farcinica]|uniref:hypothetical protein n=1 Tax=Nocardia farcinica TaxID=37329 RepID=UPI0018951662|nr:hypothetical protein [Nocardia farcinica]MBF6422590.1 hypothetical protein [Nocardia farcinica]MBF6434254.1 hypothetical protein [Nocardia farcinica]MBF6505338.1 hypothetical protein [Nocardia farcinica]
MGTDRLTMGTEASMMRWLPRPRQVPRAIVVLPRDWPPPDRRPLAVMGGGVDLRLADQWIAATLHRWIRTQLGFWLGEVAFEWTSRNRQLCIPTRQWVHQHAIRLPDEQPPGGRDEPPRTTTQP